MVFAACMLYVSNFLIKSQFDTNHEIRCDCCKVIFGISEYAAIHKLQKLIITYINVQCRAKNIVLLSCVLSTLLFCNKIVFASLEKHYSVVFHYLGSHVEKKF